MSAWAVGDRVIVPDSGAIGGCPGVVVNEAGGFVLVELDWSGGVRRLYAAEELVAETVESAATDTDLHEELRRSSQAGLAAVIAGARLAGLVVVGPDESSGDEL